MNYGRTTPTRCKAIVSILVLLACTLAPAQARQVDSPASSPSTLLHAKVPLVSDTCPAVAPGDVFTLDWNPSFYPASAATGLQALALTFAALSDDGVTIRSRQQFSLGGRRGGILIASIGNGYFHIEASVPRGIAPGIYRLIEAQASAQIYPGYQGPSPRMTVSPVSDRYCITFVAPSTQRASPAGN